MNKFPKLFCTVALIFHAMTALSFAQSTQPTNTTRLDANSFAAENQRQKSGETYSHNSVDGFLRLSADSINRQFQSISFMITVVGSFLVAASVGLAFFVSRWLQNTQNVVRESISVLVQGELSSASGVSSSFNDLYDQLKIDFARHEEVQRNLADLERYNSALETGADDPSFSYQEVQRIEYNAQGNMNRDQRKIAEGHLNNIVSQGKNGFSDPNLLYNASVVANRMNFDMQSLHLAHLASHFKSSASHRMLVADVQNTFGSAFKLEDHELIKTNETPSAIRKAAREGARIEVLRAPREGCELVYSRLANIATRERESGFIDTAIEAIEISIDVKLRKSALKKSGVDYKLDNPLTSYAYVTLADLHSQRGDPGWRDKYHFYVEKAFSSLVDEPSIATWYSSTIEGLRKTASRLGKTEYIDQCCEKYKIDLSDFESDEEKIRKRFLEEMVASFETNSEEPIDASR